MAGTGKSREERARQLLDFDSRYVGIVAGMDEAGRGPLAGDVIAACVVDRKSVV